MSQVEALEQQKKEFQEIIARRGMAQRLAGNRDFKKLILEEFCINECARYAQNSANPALSSDERADSLAIAQASGHLRRYLSVVVQMGNAAENQMVNLDDAIADARIEEANFNGVGTQDGDD